MESIVGDLENAVSTIDDKIDDIETGIIGNLEAAIGA